MPGNEKEITKFLVLSKGKISLGQLGIVNSVGVPNLSREGCLEIIDVGDVDGCLSTEDSRKKADIYVTQFFCQIDLKRTGQLLLRQLEEEENCSSSTYCSATYALPQDFASVGLRSPPFGRTAPEAG